LENRRKNFAEYLQKHRALVRAAPPCNGVDSRAQLQRNEELKMLIRRGIPAEQRRRIWPFITGASKMKESHPGYYHGVLNQHRQMESVATKQIELVSGGRLSSGVPSSNLILTQDIRRTFPGHPVFDSEEGVEKLKRVLVCYSWRNPEVGCVCGCSIHCITRASPHSPAR
jgi:hypothetical protein